MKKLISLILCATCSFCTMAQSVSKAHSFESNLYFSPATLCGGKSYVSLTEDNKLKIYDPASDFQCIKEIDIPTYIPNGCYTETATVTLTGAELSTNSGTNPQYYISSTSIDISKITTSKALADSLKKTYSNYTAVTLPGVNYPAAANDFYLPEIFGKIYPQGGYCIIDGVYNQFFVYYYPTYDESQATWKRTSTSTSDSRNAINSYEYIDVDAGNQDGNSFYCTKSLFNSDDKWEWIETVYGEPTKKIVNVNLSQHISANNYVISRNVNWFAASTEIKIMSEDGVILTINEPKAYLNYIYKIQGNIYFEIQKDISSDNSYNFIYDLYKYIPGTTSVKKVLSNIKDSNKSGAKFITRDGKIAIRAIDGKIYSTEGIEIK